MDWRRLGLTVVFQDFILAFFGWFVLMGRNGIRVGDWVEINGVGGEVVEIGLFRTALLETGNWTDKGHPTGRRVTFINNFAITGQYFNFSTAGQWMWDEIGVNVPSGEDMKQDNRRDPRCGAARDGNGCEAGGVGVEERDEATGAEPVSQRRLRSICARRRMESILSCAM